MTRRLRRHSTPKLPPKPMAEHHEQLMSFAEYEQRCQATLAERLLTHLVEIGVISGIAEMELRYPSEEQLADAEERLG